MKKITGAILAMLLVLGWSLSAFADLAGKKAEFDKTKQYLNVLDKKIAEARAARKINKVAQLKALKQKELERAKALKEEIAKLERAPRIEPTRRAEPGKKSGWLIGAGYGGGAGIVDLGYVWPIQNRFDLILCAGLGVGNQYTIMEGKIAGKIPVGGHFVGIEAGLENYSQAVTGITGLSGNVSRGANYGGGVFAGTTLGDFQVQVGYNTALGLTAGALYKFF